MKKQDSKNKNELTQGQMMAILEDVNSKFDLILEQFSIFQENMDGMRQEIRSNHDEFLVFRKEMLGFKDETDKNFKAVFEYLSKIDDEIFSLKNEFSELKVLLAGKAELQRVIDAEKRLAKLEKLVFAKLH